MSNNELTNTLLSVLDTLNIPGASLAIQYRRTTSFPIDSTSTWESLENATRYARNTDTEPYVPYDGQVISVEGEENIYVLIEDKTISTDDGRNHFKLHKISTEEEAVGKYLSKIVEDTAEKLIHFKEGIDVIGTLTAAIAKFSDDISSNDYAEKLLGWIIKSSGDAEFNSVRVRGALDADELRYNRVSIISGEAWNAPGGGIIESIDEANKLIHLKLEPGEIAQTEVDDICKGIFNNKTGFQTAYFRITEKISESTFKFAHRSGYDFPPCELMHFVAYGNFTNKNRQRSSYRTQSYDRYMVNVNGWEITKDMIAMQLGDLSNLKPFGIDMTGHSAYLRNIYMTGTIKQLSSDGVTETQIPAFKGKWSAGKHWYYDEVTHNGSTWLCIAETTTQEPSDTSTDWLKYAAKGETGEKGNDGEKGEQGDKGEDGTSVQNVDVLYYLSTSPITLTGGTWVTIAPTWVDGKYMWTRSTVTYTDTTTTTTNPICVTGGKGAQGIQGLQGLQGEQGNQGIPGPKGTDGLTTYFHIKYAPVQPPTSAQMTETPNDYIGTYVDTTASDSSDPGKYTWARFKGIQGTNGTNGIPGINGADGKTSYLHIKYSDNGTSFTANNGEIPGQWIGQCTDFTEADSNTFSVYKWTKVKGDKGDTGSNGVGIQSTDVMYYLSLSSSSLTGGAWSTTAPAWVNGRYMWSKTKVVYTNGTFNESNPACITGGKGNDGSNGSNGKGIVSIVEQYYSSASSMSQTGGSWITTVPTWANGKYIWTRSVITYTDGTSSTTSPVCVTGGKGETGVTGLPGALLRPRGEWKASTAYVNNSQFRDTVIYNGNTYSCSVGHTSGGSFDTSKWTLFNEFINVATQLLIAQNATIDVLGTSGIFVGDLAKTKGWLLSGGAIKHNASGVELTADGKLSLPESGAMMVGNRTFITNGKIVTDFIDVDNLKVKNLEGATGSFKELQAIDDKGITRGKISFNAFGSSDDVPSSLNINFSKTWISGDLYQQGHNYNENRSWRFYTSDLWCRGEFGHRRMTSLKYISSSYSDVFFHVYGSGNDTTYHKYAQSGQPIDCLVLQGNANYIAHICGSDDLKSITVANDSGTTKRVRMNHQSGNTLEIAPWAAKTFLTGGIDVSGNPNGVNNLFGI